MATPPFLKPFEAWVTGLTDRYRYNPFVRTTTHIIVLQVVFAILMIGIFTWAIQYAQSHTLGSVSYHIQKAVEGATTTESLPQAVANVRNRTLEYVFLGLVLFTALFGFLLARFALRPARNSVQFQKRFIGNVAHEIRTPLAIIKTNTEVALFDPNLAPEVKQTFEDTLGELDRISEIINNLLSFNTLTRPNRMTTEVVSLGTIAETVVQRHEALARTRKIKLISSIDTNGMVLGNPVALEQVLTNLLKNALNYTPQDKNGIVEVTVETDSEGRVAATIADTGIGIAQKDLYHIFEPFYRGDTSRARGIGTGTSGLGLAIVNEIVRLHRGSINIRSAPGRGTSVRLSFPAASQTVAPDPLLDENDDDIREVSVDFFT